MIVPLVNCLPAQRLDMVAVDRGISVDDAAYFQPLNGFMSSFANAGTHASLSTVTKSPVVNLENLNVISSIECTKGQMVVQFTDESYSFNAFKAWSETPDLTLIMGEHRHCSSSLVRFSNIELHASLISLRTLDVSLSQVLEEFDLVISTVNSKNPNIMSKTSKPLLSIPLNANYNTATGQVINREIPIFKNQISSLYCQDCHTKGSLDLYFRVKGKLGSIVEYDIRLNGQVIADLGLAFSLDTGVLTTKKMRIFNYPLTPINLGGLFVFGPEASLSVSSEFIAQARMNALSGVIVTIPLSAQLSKNHKEPLKPQGLIASRLEFKNLTVSAGAKASAAANIHPEIKLSLRGLSGLVDFEASVDFRQSAVVRADACAQVSDGGIENKDFIVGTSLYWEQRKLVNIKVRGTEREVYRSRPFVYNLPCEKCTKCPA